MKQHMSRAQKRITVKTPAGRLVTHYEERKPGRASCAKCGVTLHGTPAARPIKLKSIAKTKKRPQRPFGGQLCSSCTRAEIKMRARGLFAASAADSTAATTAT
mgnify:CR=1 FL=1